MSDQPVISGPVFDAVEALFSLCEAINKNGLSANDLADALTFAIEDGWDMALINLCMMQVAIEIARDRRNETRKGEPK